MKYSIKLEINGIEFQIETLAGSEREAKDNAWEIIRRRTSFLSIEKEQNHNDPSSFGKRLTHVIKSALVL